MARCAIDALLVTRSQDGMTLIQRDGPVTHLAGRGARGVRRVRRRATR
ncbi:MAG: hypothetical protein WDO24_19615 [Pseudomonadota bacterium]